VIDISDQEMGQKITIVNNILKELKVHTKKIIYVFNKIDAFSGNAEELLKKINKVYASYLPQFISVTTDYGIQKLITEIEKQLST
jgi:50S ribosomal subunit-associated GTPase HflX